MKSGLGRLARELGDADRTLQLANRRRAGEEPASVLKIKPLDLMFCSTLS